MQNTEHAIDVGQFLAADDLEALKEACASSHPATVADSLSDIEPEQIQRVLNALEAELAAEVFHHLDEDIQESVVETLRRGELARLVTRMAPDDRVDLLKRIPDDRQHALLQALAVAEREDIRRLASYEEGTVGSIMTTDYATLPASLTAQRAIDRLRVAAPDKETIYYAYVVDDNRKLLGFVSLKDLILAWPQSRVEDLMHRDVISVNVHDDQEVVARQISKYDLLALPVVDNNGALLGIVTHDDAMDVLMQENTEDMEKLMAIGGAHEAAAYLRTPALHHFKNRCGWIVALAMLGLVSGAIVHNFEELLLQFAILATFMPMLADTGGNTGSQSATLVVRALAIGEVKPRDVLRIISKELVVAVLLAVVLGLFSVGRVWLFAPDTPLQSGITLTRIGFAVALALGLQVITSTLIGALLPLGAAKLKLDPAVVASPALTTIVDISGLLIFFSTAKIVLGV